MKHGSGHMKYADGSSYNGDWVENEIEGSGVFTAGPVDQLRNGKLIWPANSIYTGQWKDSQRSGHGTLTLQNGDIFEGEWVEGKRNGLGVLRGSDGSVLQEGEWCDDMLVVSEVSKANAQVSEVRTPTASDGEQT